MILYNKSFFRICLDKEIRSRLKVYCFIFQIFMVMPYFSFLSKFTDFNYMFHIGCFSLLNMTTLVFDISWLHHISHQYHVSNHSKKYFLHYYVHVYYYYCGMLEEIFSHWLLWFLCRLHQMTATPMKESTKEKRAHIAYRWPSYTRG